MPASVVPWQDVLPVLALELVLPEQDGSDDGPFELGWLVQAGGLEAADLAALVQAA